MIIKCWIFSALCSFSARNKSLFISYESSSGSTCSLYMFVNGFSLFFCRASIGLSHNQPIHHPCKYHIHIMFPIPETFHLQGSPLHHDIVSGLHQWYIQQLAHHIIPGTICPHVPLRRACPSSARWCLGHSPISILSPAFSHHLWSICVWSDPLRSRYQNRTERFVEGDTSKG